MSFAQAHSPKMYCTRGILCLLWYSVLLKNGFAFIFDGSSTVGTPQYAYITTTATPCQDNPEVNCQLLQGVTHDMCNINNNMSKVLCRRFCNKCDVYDGQWSEWLSWSSCSVTCDSGTKSRTRACTNPAPQNGGDNCSGNGVESLACKLDACPVHGSWGLWTSWGECSETCGVGLQRRDRYCDNPWPSKNGDHCFGEPLAYRICHGPSCSAWSDWNSWGGCSRTCGYGIKTRSRQCSGSGNWNDGSCRGDSTDFSECHTPCPQIAFTATSPGSSPLTRYVTFTNVITNEGSGFNPTMGVFTCPKSGLYYFSMHIVKIRSNDESINDAAQCYLRKNHQDAGIYTYTDPQDIISSHPDSGADYGSYEAGNSGYIRLVKGDQIQIYDARYYLNRVNLHAYSSFSGLLVAPDEY